MRESTVRAESLDIPQPSCGPFPVSAAQVMVYLSLEGLQILVVWSNRDQRCRQAVPGGQNPCRKARRIVFRAVCGAQQAIGKE